MAFAITLSTNPLQGFAYIAINTKITVRFQSVVEGIRVLTGLDKTSNLTNYRADFQQPVLINYQQTLVNNYLQLIYDLGARVNCFATCGRATLVAYHCHLFAGNCTADPPHRAMAGPCFFYTLFKTGNKICQGSLAWSSYLLCTCFVFASYLLLVCFVPASRLLLSIGVKQRSWYKRGTNNLPNVCRYCSPSPHTPVQTVLATFHCEPSLRGHFWRSHKNVCGNPPKKGQRMTKNKCW